VHRMWYRGTNASVQEEEDTDRPRPHLWV